MHLAQIKSGAAPCVIDQFGKGVGQTTRTHIVDGQNRRHGTQGVAMVDDLLGTALNFGVTALHGVKVQSHVVAAAGQRAGGTPTHANAHTRPAQLYQQSARGKFNFAGQLPLNHTQASRNHDGLVVAALHAIDHLFVLAEIAQQIRASEFIVECSATQGTLGHDGQGTGHVRRLPQTATPQFGNAEPR